MVPPGGRVYRIHTKQVDISWLFVSFLNLFLVQVWSNYNVVLITVLEQSDSVISFFVFFPIMVYPGY